MPFITQVDLSGNRQIKERPRTSSILSGATQLGIPFSALTSGPDYSNEAITSSVSGLTSTFTGTSATTVYTWAQPNMVLGEAVLSAVTPSNSGVTQNTDSVYSAWTTTTIDGNLVVLTYSGVSFDISINQMVELAPNLYSGNTNTAVLDYLSANTLDFTGRTIWSDVKGISRTEKLIVSDNPTIGYVLMCSHIEGMAVWSPIPSTNFTGGTVSGSTNFTGGLTANVFIDLKTTLTATTNSVSSATTTYYLDATSNNVTATLPNANTHGGYTFWFKRIDNTGSVVTVDVGASDFIDKAPSVTLAYLDGIAVKSDGTNWWSF